MGEEMSGTDSKEQDGGRIPESKREKSLRFSVWDASFYAAMVGFAETYFIPLLVFLGATNAQVGIYSAAPQLGIAFAQFLSIILVDRYMVRKRIVVATSSIQSIFLLAITVLTFYNLLSPWTMILLTMFYFAVNGASLPAWNSLMGDLTTAESRGKYFGRRNGLSQLISFAAIFAGGLILQQYDNRDNARLGFTLVLAAALLCRLGSIYSLSRHFEAPYRKDEDSYFSFWQFIKRTPQSNFAHFVLFVAFMSLSVQLAAPFFAVYMLRDLGFSYLQYTIAQGVFTASQFMAMRKWGPFADKYGNRLVLRITSAIIPVVPLLWFLSVDFYFIVVIQIAAGLAWAGWSLATANFLFDAVTPPKRARAAAYLNFFNSFGICIGSLFGAALAVSAPPAIASGAVTIIYASPLQHIFLISSGLRFVFVFLFMATVREVRKVDQPVQRDMFTVLSHIRPFAGLRHDPYTGSGDQKKEPE